MREWSIRRRWMRLALAALGVGIPMLGAQAAESVRRLDLSKAVVVASESVQAKTLDMLQDEVEKRTGIRPALRRTMPSDATPAIVLGMHDRMPAGRLRPPRGLRVPDKAEGYAVWTDARSRPAPTVYLVGHDQRGVLFATGRLLRLLRLAEGRIALASDVRVATAPKYSMRGHQLGYRDTANSYDAWDLEQYEQYIRDLVAFGTNSIELIRDGDRAKRDGPVLTRSQWEMNVALTKLIASYGLDVWFWEPLHSDVRDPSATRKELEERQAFYEACAVVDHVMVPGGDPGRTTPDVLMPWLEKQSQVLRRAHPEAGLWVSHQKFTPKELDTFFAYINEKKPDWLTGVVYGPHTAISLAETRKRLPSRYSIRRYPDITHNLRCQYPIPAWDGIWAQTLGREATNPRPVGTAHIHNRFAKWSTGFVSYSDGCHDDLNKMIWSALGWDPDADLDSILRDYGRLFFGPNVADDVAEGLRRLEQNLQGPIRQAVQVEATLDHWLDIEKSGGATLSDNWRFQLYLFRAYFDAYIRARHVAEMKYQDEAYAALARAREVGAAEAIAAARKALGQADRVRVRPRMRARIETLGATLLESIGMQYRVTEPYRARNTERGALLDKVDRPLNDRPWLEVQFKEIMAESDPDTRLARIDTILNWENPGPGGFYDDLGNTRKQPHLVRQTTWVDDPGFQRGPQEAHYKSMEGDSTAIRPLKLSWLDYAQTSGDTPLLMRYEGLDATAKYRLRVTYFGRYGAVMRLVADGKHEIHGALPMPKPIWPREFDIPQEATADGTLDLAWHLVDRRGCQVPEVWLMKRD